MSWLSCPTDKRTGFKTLKFNERHNNGNITTDSVMLLHRSISAQPGSGHLSPSGRIELQHLDGVKGALILQKALLKRQTNNCQRASFAMQMLVSRSFHPACRLSSAADSEALSNVFSFLCSALPLSQIMSRPGVPHTWEMSAHAC